MRVQRSQENGWVVAVGWAGGKGVALCSTISEGYVLVTELDQGATEPASLTAGQLLDVLWTTLSDLLGTAATATLLRRSMRALPGHPELEQLKITRAALEYSYVVPETWHAGSDQSMEVLRELVRAVSPILRELTGEVVVRYLDNVPAFRASGISFS